MDESKTPETDAQWAEVYDLGGNTITWFEAAALMRPFARSLELRLNEALERERRLLEKLGSTQAVLDRMMLENCPKEMSESQISDWESSQRAAGKEASYKLDEAIGRPPFNLPFKRVPKSDVDLGLNDDSAND